MLGAGGVADGKVDLKLIGQVADYITLFEALGGPKIGTVKRRGPSSPKFKGWKYGLEDALSRLLGADSKAAIRFRAVKWPDAKGREFDDAVDEVIEIVGCALHDAILLIPELGSIRAAMPQGPFPSELQHILNEIQLCLGSGAYDAVAVMVRKAVEAAIYLRFERDDMLDELLTGKGDTLSFGEKVQKAAEHNYLSPSKGTELKQVKWWGDSGAHSYKVIVGQSDATQLLTLLSLCLQEIFPKSLSATQ
jgi:hypothetical protein